MRAFSLRLLAVFMLTAGLWGCKNVKEDLQLESPLEYVQLQPGKYITYQLDSTIFTQLGRNVEIHSYQEKHVIDAQFTDNEGRPSYRVYRYLRDTAGTKPWSPSGTYMITVSGKSIEVIEDNMRIIKLANPVREGFMWQGNRFLVTEPFSSKFNFDNDDEMPYWEFTYENLNDTFRYKNQDLNNVIKVVHIDERPDIDTLNVNGNTVSIPQNTSTAWVRGNPTDTVIITALPPSVGHEQLTIYNRTTKYASLNKILIPPGLALYFEYANGKWYYPNPLTVVNNRITFPRLSSIAYLFGTATDTIKVDVTQLDTMKTRRVTIYNKSNKDAYAIFNPNNPNLSKKLIPPGYGRSYELMRGIWRLYEDKDELLEKDPYLNSLPYSTTTVSNEKYTKGLGLVFQELLIYEYQHNQGSDGYRVGFGVKRSMIDHN